MPLPLGYLGILQDSLKFIGIEPIKKFFEEIFIIQEKSCCMSLYMAAGLRIELRLQVLETRALANILSRNIQ